MWKLHEEERGKFFTMAVNVEWEDPDEDRHSRHWSRYI